VLPDKKLSLGEGDEDCAEAYLLWNVRATGRRVEAARGEERGHREAHLVDVVVVEQAPALKSWAPEVRSEDRSMAPG